MTSSLEGEGGGRPKVTCDDMMTRGGGGGKGLMTKYPPFTEILGMPLISNTFQGSSRCTSCGQLDFFNFNPT